MNIRLILTVTGLIASLGVAMNTSADQLYTCKINPSSPSVAGVKTGTLSHGSGYDLKSRGSPYGYYSVRIGACKGTGDWAVASKEKIAEASIVARKGDVTETWLAVTMAGPGCICVTDPCPCASGGPRNSQR